MTYPPREDSFLLAEEVRKRARGSFLDMGTGSGIIAKAARDAGGRVLSADIDPNAGCDGIPFRQSDLFENVPESFDMIAFNPPYLPNDDGFHDLALHGGRTGRETLERFLSEAPRHLKSGGEIIFLQSSIAGIEQTKQALLELGYEFEIPSRQRLFMEEIVVFRAWAAR